MPINREENKNTTSTKESVKELHDLIIEAMQDRKGSKITDINLEVLETAPARRFIICEGKSTTQVSAIADNIQDEVREKSGRKPYHTDGYRNSQWIIIDYGDIMAHVFIPEAREQYNLEDLWNDADITRFADLD